MINLLSSRLTTTFIIFFTSVFIAYTNNILLWSVLSEDASLSPALSFEIGLVIFLLVAGVIWAFMSIFLHPGLLKSIAIILLISTAIIGFFSQQLKVVFHLDMIRNIVENIKDHNANEALELISFPLIKHLLIFGILPSVPIVLASAPVKSLKKELVFRAGGLLIIAVLFTVIALPKLDFIKEYGREHRNLRFYVNPVSTVASVIDYMKQSHHYDAGNFIVLGQDARQEKITSKRTVGILFVGETARGDHFSLNGYSRKTNPMLEKVRLVNFPDTRSCGTSTIFSVPCMFSFLNRENYSPETAANQSNVLDVLETAGVKTFWVDNNSSCKGVCERIENINIRESPSTELPFYGHGEYFDEVLLYQLEEKISSTDSDMLIVLHMLGSHGPAYYKRVPENFIKFTPQCTKKTYLQCNSNQEFVNAYDNTLLYTDFVLNKAIDLLNRHQEDFDSFMVYASDHGESLGENGIYLHGAPYDTAPEAQTHIPFLAWLSDGYLVHHDMNLESLQKKAKAPHSHDNLSHSMLGLFDVKTDVYHSELNAFTDTKRVF